MEFQGDVVLSSRGNGNGFQLLDQGSAIARFSGDIEPGDGGFALHDDVADALTGSGGVEFCEEQTDGAGCGSGWRGNDETFDALDL